MPHKPTDEQEAGLEAFRTGNNIVFNAGAGTGKTTLLNMMANDTNDKGVYIAFNSALCDDALVRLPCGRQEVRSSDRAAVMAGADR
jgi:superfamily II DNA or RNA helicase